MDFFTIKGSSTPYRLERDIYERITLKQEPYYKGGKNYAICPGCGNVIQIINLDNNNTSDSHRRLIKTYSRHVEKSIEGLSEYSREKYYTCPFSNPVNFSSTKKRMNDEEENEIINIIKKYSDCLYKMVNGISGIHFSYNKFKEMLENFLSSEGYNYLYINKFNLPYGFLNMQKGINIYKQAIYSEKGLSVEIKNAINEKSIYFHMLNYIIEKKTEEYAEIKFYLRNHKIGQEAGEQSIELVIFESRGNGDNNIIFNKRIEIDMYSFSIIMDETGSIRNIADKVLKKVLK
ncbi:hypothetical protein PMW00_11370 [Clostridium paraputrificum]|uniref:hypothetical protein n=1 Tax=Clostridium paraputrificum TaxID=29363 RepID=UPI00232B5F61|nr:hypothetical protein [Clostridium paraputrificum]MDB2103621.1 hypothetical protein [Clostridium paraputrificum]